MRKKLPREFESGRMEGSPWSADRGMSGAFEVRGPNGRTQLRIISTDAVDPAAEGWEHVSVSTDEYRTPTWEEMCFVKDVFWQREEAVMQLHPPENEYVNNHQYVLHLWRHVRKAIPLPPPIFVGVKGEGTFKNRAEAAAGLVRAIKAGLFK